MMWRVRKAIVPAGIMVVTGFLGTLKSYAIPYDRFSDTFINQQTQTFSASQIVAKDSSLSRGIPKPKLKTIFFQYGAGTLVGGAFTAIGALLGSRMGYCKDESFICIDMYAFVLGFIGYNFGNAAGVYWAGNNKAYHGAYGTTLGGCFLGSLAEIGLLAIGSGIIPESQIHTRKFLAIVSIIIVPTSGAIIAFNKSRNSPWKRLRFDVGIMNLEAVGRKHIGIALAIPNPKIEILNLSDHFVYGLGVPILNFHF